MQKFKQVCYSINNKLSHRKLNCSANMNYAITN